MRKLLFVSRITVLTLLSLRRLESTIACIVMVPMMMVVVMVPMMMVVVMVPHLHDDLGLRCHRCHATEEDQSEKESFCNIFYLLMPY
jgi:hypothetical protein